VLGPFRRAWWERAGKPEAGPVFPVRIGKRAGQEKKTNSHAKRLRSSLMRAGVFRLPPTEVPETGKGRRTDLGKEATGTKLAPDPRDPLYFETEVSLPVDFHSFRRAFNTALAEAGVNVQRAMHLASHSDPRVHHRYVMRTKAMQQIPAEALPQLPAGGLTEAPRQPRIVTARDDSREESGPRSKILSDSSRRDWCRTSDPYRVNAPKDSATPTIAHACNAEDTANGDRDLPCFPVSPDDSSRNVSASGTTSGPYQPGVSSSAVDVETGLATALLRAAEAGRFDVVAQLAHELEARRLARAGNVVGPDDGERGKR
jgi:hypothetical protein